MDWPKIQEFAKRDYLRAHSLVRKERRRLGRMPNGPEMIKACDPLGAGRHPGFVALRDALHVLGWPVPEEAR